MEVSRVLDDVLTKKELSKDNRKRAVSALLELSSDINNSKQTAEYLMKLHYSACPTYFERAASDLDDEQLSSVVNAILANEQFIKGNQNNFLYPKGFTSVLALAKKDKFALAFSLLNNILSQTEKSGYFSDGCMKNFKKFVVDRSGLSFFQKLLEVVNEETFIAKPFEKRRFERFLDSVVDKTVVTAIAQSPVKITPLAVPPKQMKKDEKPAMLEKSDIHVPTTENVMTKTQISKIESAQTEILGILHKLSDNRMAIDTLTAQLVKKESELSAAHLLIKEKEQQLSTVYVESRRLKENLVDSESKIADLNDRLRTSLNMDEISKNQELATLKNDISEALKLDFSDFMGTKGNEYSQDLFEAYRSTLMRIFKLLKRFGITCE